MDLSLKYSKTSKGAKAVLSKSRALSSQCMQVLSNIDGKVTASAIQTKLQLKEEKFAQALAQLLDEAYIQVVQDFGPTVFDLNSAIEVSEISTEEFLKLELPQEQGAKTQEQLDAEARARAYAEEQARKEAQAREQQEAERKLLMVTDILAKSGHKIDIEKLAEPSGMPSKPESPAKLVPVISPDSNPSPTAKIPDLGGISLNFSTPTTDNVPRGVDTKVNLRADSINPAGNSEPPQKAPTQPQPSVIQEDQSAEREIHTASAVITETENLANAEAERKAQEESARRAREKAEIEAKEQEIAERKAREKAEIEARRAAEAEAKVQEQRRKAEEKARKEEERRIRKEAEAARKRAQQQAKEEEKAKAKAEAERKAKEEADRRAREKAEAGARAREIAERKAKEKAELEARRAAEAEIKAEAARKAKEEARLRDQARAIEKAAVREVAKREAQERALVRAEEWSARRAAFARTSAASSQYLLSISRPLLMGLGVLIIALLVLLQFVSLNLWSKPIEHAIAASIGEPVQIRDLRASLWPTPHLVVENVSVGAIGDVAARSVYIYPSILTLWSSHKTLDAVEVEGLTLAQESLKRPVNWVDNANKQQKYRLKHITLKNVMIQIPGQELPTFDAELTLNTEGTMASATLKAKNISAEVVPAESGMTTNILGQNWQLPMGAPIQFDELTAKGSIGNEKLELQELEGILYGGSIKGWMTVDWSQGWNLTGTFQLANINLAEATPSVSEFAQLQGRVYATAELDASAERPELLLLNPAVQARFEAEQGQIGGLDLARAASGRDQVSGLTRFDELSGLWVLKDGQYQLNQLALKAGSLTAQGEITISADQELSGRLQTRLDLGSRQFQGRLNLSGKMGSVRISR